MMGVFVKRTVQKMEVGQQIGHWLITGNLERVGADYRYPCRCSCGSERMVSAITLRNGTSTSCGCRKRNPERKKEAELLPISPAAQKALNLINRGVLPPADQFSVRNGAPAWTLESIAVILGINEKELLLHLEQAGQRFFDSGSLESPPSFSVAA